VSVPAPGASTEELLNRVRTGDRAALEALYERYLGPLQRWARGRLPSRARDLTDTADIVQETLLRTLRRLDTFQVRDTGSFYAYLRQAVLNRIHDEGRRVARRPRSTELEDAGVDPGPSPVEQLLGREALDRFEGAVARLAANDREAVLARMELGLSYAEIARSLGKPSPDAARMTVARALVRLAREMAV
jgi:RNA polymerase sigma factor (sigma-70 family)